jgi:hypothetical protein
MNRKQRDLSAFIAAVLTVALTVLGFAAGASAHEGEFAKFDYCPSTNPEVNKCIYSVTEGGKVVLGNKTVPIVNPVTLQGGFGKPNGERISAFFGATNGVTLSKTPQPVPGGLLGIVPPEDSPWLVKQLSKFFFENGLTGVNSTLELAKPASEIQISERNLILRKGVALKLPVKVHLENPFLGNHCFVGSSSSPLIWNLTTGKTSPPEGTEPIEGKAGKLEFKEGGEILQINGNELVDNAWSAPKAEGCGGILSFLVDPVIDSMIGLPSVAGHNVAILQNTVSVSPAAAVNER